MKTQQRTSLKTSEKLENSQEPKKLKEVRKQEKELENQWMKPSHYFDIILNIYL